ncbi:hypothetical protein [Clostridium cochlearium]|uniref:Alpha-NAC protein n=1 Tax=Clostridium cochlearium TaxID=1494 RepID=A0A7Y3Y0B9_CLOCO|nr:hypothetical protein [Clostridium cochlearium]NOH17184.1 hypothetical protein [Clostridium cochlearium]
MNIQGYSNFQYIFNLHNNPNKTMEDQAKINKARKENPILDRVLYQNDINKMFEEQAKIEKIAKKIARGENLSKEERELISEADPEMLRKAEMAKQENEALKRSLKNAKSKQQAQRILAEACIKAQLVSKVDPQYSDLLMDTIQELHEDFNKTNTLYDETKNYGQNRKNSRSLVNLKL